MDSASLRAAYNLGNRELTLTQLIKELQSSELMLNLRGPFYHRTLLLAT